MAPAPRIGIAMCQSMTDYLESIRRYGGEPVVLDRSMPVEQALGQIDGLLLTGGGDVDPNRYRAQPHQTVHLAEEGRDEFEIGLIEQARKEDRPLLAVCRGIQVLNVAAGGTLIQDIPSEIAGALEHHVAEPRFALAHDVWIAAGSKLYGLLQERLGAHDECPVNSRHHQAVGKVAEGFQVTATAPDGVIEALEAPDARFLVGVQWHPENFWRTGEFRTLFEGFIQASRTSGP